MSPAAASPPAPDPPSGRRAVRPRGLGLTARIALAASTLTLAVLLLVGATSYQATRTQITRSELVALDNHASLLASKLSATLGSVVSTLGPLADNALILNSLMDSLTRDTSLSPFLEDFSTVNGIPVEIALVDFEGNPVAGRGAIVAETRDWREQVLEAGLPYAAVQRDSRGLYLLVAQPVFYMRTLSPEGALIHRIELPLSIFGGRDEGERVRLLQAGRPILESSGQGGDGAVDAPLLSRVRALDLPPILEPLGLAVEVIALRSTSRAPLESLFRAYAVAALVIIGLVVVSSVFAARRLTRPLRELEEAAAAVVASGSFDHRFDAAGAPELVRLADAFNRMLERLGVAYAKLADEAKLESERRAALTEANTALQAEMTERQRAEAEAEHAGRLLADAIENMTDGFALFDENHRLVLCNETYRAMFPAIAADLVPGADYERLLGTASDRGQYRQVVHAETGQPVDRVVAWRDSVPVELHTGEGRWILARDRITGRGGRVSVRIDITDRRNAECALAEHAEELARSNAELEQFAYVASHDLQEPLRKVHAFGDLLEMSCAAALDDTGREYLQRIRGACGRMQTLIDDLLGFSRVSRGERREGPVDLNRIVEQVTSDLAVSLAESGGRIESGTLPIVLGDALHMGQLFQNLIGNALKYSRPGVTPVVRVAARMGADAGDARAGAGQPPCVVSVRDNGIGFEQKYAERIFGVFQRLHGSGEYRGTGIGLAICRKIVERHGGEIHASSEPGVGTEVTFTLPVAEAMEMRAAG